MWTGPDLWHDRCIESCHVLLFVAMALYSLENPLTFLVSWDPEPESHWVPRRRNPALGMLRTWPGPHTISGAGRYPVFPEIAFIPNSRAEWA